MSTPATLIAESTLGTNESISNLVVETRPEDTSIAIVCADGATFTVSRLIGSHVRKGDELIVPPASGSAARAAEVLVHRPASKRADLYHARVGYAAQPKPDRRGEMFIRVEVAGGQLGLGAIHIPCYAIRDYFFAANRSLPWNRQESLYRFLRLTRGATVEELRLGFRIRRMELKLANASKTDFAALERVYNLLADPQLRTAYDDLLVKPDAPIPFPYSGFGTLLVEGEPAAEGSAFFARRILAFLPERRRRTLTFPLRNLDFFSDYAIVRDRQRKLEVLIDQQLLPLKWDQTWSQWRHLITASIEISADFIRTGKSRKRNGAWQLVEWETALPSRTEVTIPPDVQDSILKARNAHSRFGRYFDDIDRLRWHVQQIPTECDELRRRCWSIGLPGDFDVVQITWRPDYDPYYYEQLSKRARRMYLFREEYIIDLAACVVVEVPQGGHATYVFAKPARLEEFVWQYAKTAARQRASQLMAPGPALTLPRLAGAALEPFQPRTAYSGAFGLARNLLLAKVGRPEDWEQSKGDPVAFMLRTVERAAAGFNRKAIDGVAHSDILFGTSPYISSWHERECETPDRVFLAVEATHISIVYLRPTLELLAKAHPRLPATFYRMLLESACSWILCYDESACGAFYEWRMEAYEEAQQSGEEGLEKPQSIATAKGPWLAKRFKPHPPANIDAAIESLKSSTQARRILDAARRLHALAKARERTRPYCDMWDEYYPNGGFSVPFTILAFHEQDLVCQAFQSDEEDWMNGGEQQSPAFATAFDPKDPESVAAGFGEFRHFLRMMEGLGELLALLPGCDLLEEQK